MSKELLMQGALDLEDSLPKSDTPTVGGIISDIVNLVSALKAGDYNAARKALIAILEDIEGNEPTTLKASGINWQNVIQILGKLLPIILGGLT